MDSFRSETGVVILHAVLWTSSPEDQWYVIELDGNFYEPTSISVKGDAYEGATYLKIESSYPLHSGFRYTLTPIATNIPWSATSRIGMDDEVIGLDLSIIAKVSDSTFSIEARDWKTILGQDLFSF
jgi:hypothetical protein